MTDPRLVPEESIENLVSLMHRLQNLVNGCLGAVADNQDKFKELADLMIKAQHKTVDEFPNITDELRAKLKPAAVAEAIVVHSMSWGGAAIARTELETGITTLTAEQKRATFEQLVRCNVSLYITLISKAMEAMCANEAIMDECILHHEKRLANQTGQVH